MVLDNIFRVTDDYSVCVQADVTLIDVQTPVDEDRVPPHEPLRQVSERAGTSSGPARWLPSHPL